jgi:hypothetical protein
MAATEQVESPPQQGPVGEGVALVRDAAAAGISLRIVGGLAVQLLCPSAREAPLARPYKDLDLVGLSKERKQIEAFMAERGYEAARQFNLLHGGTQLLFGNGVIGTVDVFLDSLRMCHTLELSERLGLHELTLAPADLLLSKLQIVETTERDLRDLVALLKDAELDEAYVAEVLGADWGWWRTATGTLDRVGEFAAELPGLSGREHVQSRIAALRARIDEAPKSRRWRMRARVGERVRWYEEPDQTRDAPKG